MTPSQPSFQKTLLFVLFAAVQGLAQGPRFTARDAIRAEWARVLPKLDAARLSPADRARYDRSARRIEGPGLPHLLPPESETPTLATWEAKAQAARTPEERFTALYWLNRLKSSKALSALAGLGPADAAGWPRFLRLDAYLATARLNGAEPGPELRAFLDALKAAGKTDPVREQAARLRLVLAGKEPHLLPPVAVGPGSALALLDAWGRSPESRRAEWLRASFGDGTDLDFARALGRLGGHPSGDGPGLGWLTRLFEGLPEDASAFPGIEKLARACAQDHPSKLVRIAAAGCLWKFRNDAVRRAAQDLMADERDCLIKSALLPSLVKLVPGEAQRAAHDLAWTHEAISRATAFEQAPLPLDLDTKERKSTCTGLPASLFDLVESDGDPESGLALVDALERWKLGPQDRQDHLRRLLGHPDWGVRLKAHQALSKLDPESPLPAAPALRAHERALLREAVRLAERGRPLRLRITFSGGRRITLRLDPTVAPINVANLALLARKRYFDGHVVPRVVPDWVVQMGSPYDTMDGGPGYTVRCENSLTWYGPGSVGMALSGKDTGGSQFFITTNAAPYLVGRYTHLGVVEDLDRALPMLDAMELGAKILKVDVVK